MPHNCPICQHPRREEIDAALSEHQPDGVVSCMYGPTVAAVRQHRAHLSESTKRTSADLIGRLRRVETAAWHLYELALGGKKPNIAGACSALREVRGALSVESELLPPVRGEREQGDIEVLVRAELHGNPQLARALLAQLGPSALLEAARTTVTQTAAPELDAAETPVDAEPICIDESAQKPKPNDYEEIP